MATSHAKRVQPKKAKSPAGFVGHLPVLTAQEVFRTNTVANEGSHHAQRSTTSSSLAFGGGAPQHQRRTPSPSMMSGGTSSQHQMLMNRSKTPTTQLTRGAPLSPIEVGGGGNPLLLSSSQAQLVESIYPQAGSTLGSVGNFSQHQQHLSKQHAKAAAAAAVISETYNPGMGKPLAAPPNTAPSTIAAQQAAADANKYINSELAILSSEHGAPVSSSVTGGDTDVSGGVCTHERLGVYKTAFRMITPVMAQPVAALMERILMEHDRFMRQIEQRNAETSMLAERKRLEQHYQQHYLDAADAKERDLEQRKKEVNKTETTLLSKFRGLENQVAALKEENAKLKAQQNEDHDRIINMAQAVVDSRLSSQKAEIACREMEEENIRIKKAGQQHVDLVQDNMDMITILKSRNIAFEPRCKFVIEAMVGK